MALEFTSCESEPFLVHVWPDGDYAVKDDVYESDYAHKSDDYETINLNDFDAMRAYHNQKLLAEIIEELYGTDPFGEEA